MNDHNKQGDLVVLNEFTGIGREKYLNEFVNYWERMRKMDDVPKRTDIDPRGIEPLLENAMVAEKIAPGLARLRIAGAHLSDLMGMEVRGMPISAFFESNAREDLADLLTELFERPAVLDLMLEAPAAMGQPALQGRMLLMPLRSDLGDISRALGCLVTKGGLGRTPRRFQIYDRKITPITKSGQKLRGFAEAAPPFDRGIVIPKSRPAHRSERPYLRVVK